MPPGNRTTGAHSQVRDNTVLLAVMTPFAVFILAYLAYGKVTKTGDFQIRCAELCGLWHGYMFDTGHVVSDTQFTTWIAAQRKQFTPVQKYLPPYAVTYAPDPQARAG